MNINVSDLRAAIEKSFPRIKIRDDFFLPPDPKMIDKILEAVLEVLQEKPLCSGGAYESLAE